MAYRYTQDHIDYSDFAPGRVFTGLPGHAAFPVRLGDEMFRRALALFQAGGGVGPVTLYDPCCGGGYLLSTITLLNWGNLSRVIGSDVKTDALELATRNLSALTLEGMTARITKLEELRQLYGKESHQEALMSARRIEAQLAVLTRTHTVSMELFNADATNGPELRARLGDTKVDMVITDVPYGHLSFWHTSEGNASQQRDLIWYLLDALLPILANGAIVGIASDKKQRPSHERYHRVEKLKVGKRQIVFLVLSHSDTDPV